MAQLISIVTVAQDSTNKKGIYHFPLLYLMHVLCQDKEQYLELVKIAVHHDSMCMFIIEDVRVGGGVYRHS